jgi:nucleotide-binding universal stress UspA family protein
MYTHVIVGYDGSPSGRDALSLGKRLAAAGNAALSVVYVHPYMARVADAEADPAVEQSWREDAERVLDEARATLAGVPRAAFHAMADPSPARALHEAADEAGATLIVVGSTHRRGLGRVFPGSTADQVVHAAPCAVAVAPAGYAQEDDEAPGGVIGAAVDGGEETERVARLAARIARGAKARLRLLTIAEPHYTRGPLYAGNLGYGALRATMASLGEDALARATAAAGPDAETEVALLDGSPAEQLAAASSNLDLLVVGSRGFGPVRRVLLGSVGSAVLRSAACPVLVLPRGVAEAPDETAAPVARAAVR